MHNHKCNNNSIPWERWCFFKSYVGGRICKSNTSKRFYTREEMKVIIIAVGGLSNHIYICEQLTQTFSFFSLFLISQASGWQIVTFHLWPHDTDTVRDIKREKIRMRLHFLRPFNGNLFRQWFPDVVRNSWQWSSCMSTVLRLSAVCCFIPLKQIKEEEEKCLCVCNKAFRRELFYAQSRSSFRPLH